MTDLEFIQRCKLLGCKIPGDLDNFKEYTKFSYYAEQLHKNGITDNEFILRVIHKSHEYSLNTCSAVIGLHKYGQDDILDRLTKDMSHLRIKKVEHVKVWTNTYVDVNELNLTVTIGDCEECAERDIFVSEKDIYFRCFTDNGQFNEYEWIAVDSKGNAQRITQRYRDVVRNRKALLVTA